MAWGDTLKPGMKAIAVSRDLIDLGLVHNTDVTIEGFQGKYKVLDKMNKKWEMKIDIYMGTDIKAAKKWGKKRVKISW
jgi:3D (Asp-Asp-Asp) domain-containing protein